MPKAHHEPSRRQHPEAVEFNLVQPSATAPGQARGQTAKKLAAGRGLALRNDMPA
jgi:hypothetical protein